MRGTGSWRYRRSSRKEAPHESTVDQFFDEVQLEAYRELSYRLCKEMLEVNTQQGKNWV
jgi:hypothetical protein